MIRIFCSLCSEQEVGIGMYMYTLYNILHVLERYEPTFPVVRSILYYLISFYVQKFKRIKTGFVEVAYASTAL
jgi:hypothetical protein